MKRRAFAQLLAGAFFGLSRAALGEPARVLFVQPLGPALPKADVAAVVRALEAACSLEIRLLARRDLPRSAYYRPRARWRAEKLLEHLRRRLPDGGLRILGVTGVDISTRKGSHADWGVVGLADLDDVACVVSKFRCRRKARDASHARARLAKVAVHEIGHTLSLEHCPNQGCLMQDAGGSVLATDREHDLCADCRLRLQARGIAPGDGAYPWPAGSQSS